MKKKYHKTISNGDPRGYDSSPECYCHNFTDKDTSLVKRYPNKRLCTT